MNMIDVQRYFEPSLGRDLKTLNSFNSLYNYTLLITGLKGYGISTYLHLIQGELTDRSFLLSVGHNGDIFAPLAITLDCPISLESIYKSLIEQDNIVILVDNAHLISNPQRTLLVNLINRLNVGISNRVRFVFGGLPSLVYQFTQLSKASSDRFIESRLCVDTAFLSIPNYLNSLQAISLYFNHQLGYSGARLEQYITNQICGIPYYSLKQSECGYLLNLISKNAPAEKNIHSLSRVRDDLLKKEILYAPRWGQVEFAIPGFREYLLTNIVR